MTSVFLIAIIIAGIIGALCIFTAIIAGAATFFPALMIFVGELWLTFFRTVLALAGSLLLFIAVMICGFIALGH